ncbi:MAG: ABC transporter permease [Flexilinea sp.]
MKKFSQLHVLLVVMGIVIITMWILTGSDFMNPGNFQSMAYQMPELGILTLAMCITMLTAGINLSIIATANISGIVMAIILTSETSLQATGWTGILIIAGAILAGLTIAALAGLINGYLIAYLDLPPILATLGMMNLLNGISIVITQGYVISGFPASMLKIGNSDILSIPIPFILFLACAGILAVILNRTPLGTRIYLIGSNPVATLFSGVNNRNVLLRTYIISGLLSGVAAVVMISRFNSAKADYGESYLLLTVLASVLGGVSAAGGFGKISGIIISLFILQMISSGLNLMGVSSFLTLTLWGVILLVVMITKYVIETIQQKRYLS